MLKYHHRGRFGPNEIARWFEEHFAQEIDIWRHMRELISGAISPSGSVSWDDDAEGRARTRPWISRPDASASSKDLEMAPERASLESFPAGCTELSRAATTTAGPPGGRIETNPLSGSKSDATA
jgi:hypothetical protein